MYNFTDKLPAKTSARTITDEGYLMVPARISRVGVQLYKAGEIGLKDRDPNEVVAVYRPPEEVFSDESLKSFELKPVTNNHPTEDVTAANNKRYSVGTTYGDITHDDTYVNANLLVTDANAIAEIGTGKVEVSNGYKADLEIIDGKTADGTKYVAIQRNIRGNHIAIVKRGRAGPNVKLSDTNEGLNTVKVTINDVGYDIPDGPAADAVAKLIKDNDKLVADAATTATSHTTALADKDSEIAKLQKQIKDAPSVEDAVKERLAFADAVRVVDADYQIGDKTDAAVKAELLGKHRKELDLKDKDETYVNACFDMLVNDCKTTAKRTGALDTAIGTALSTPPTTVTDADGKPVDTRPADVKAREKRVQDNRDAWRDGQPT